MCVNGISVESILTSDILNVNIDRNVTTNEAPLNLQWKIKYIPENNYPIAYLYLHNIISTTKKYIMWEDTFSQNRSTSFHSKTITVSLGYNQQLINRHLNLKHKPEFCINIFSVPTSDCGVFDFAWKQRKYYFNERTPTSDIICNRIVQKHNVLFPVSHSCYSIL